jgi:hypothetical protein
MQYKYLLMLSFPIFLNVHLGCTSYKQEHQTKMETKSSVCLLSKEQSPELRGFRLGNSVDEIIKRYPDMKIQVDNAKSYEDSFGYYSIRFTVYDSAASKKISEDSGSGNTWSVSSLSYPEFKDIYKLNLHIQNEKVFAIYAIYDTEAKWASSSEFASYISKTMNLPNEWTNSKNEPVVDYDTPTTYDYSELKCEGFNVQAGLLTTVAGKRYGQSEPFIKIQDNVTQAAIESSLQEKKKNNEKKKLNDFKP